MLLFPYKLVYASIPVHHVPRKERVYLGMEVGGAVVDDDRGGYGVGTIFDHPVFKDEARSTRVVRVVEEHPCLDVRARVDIATAVMFGEDFRRISFTDVAVKKDVIFL